MPLVRRIQPTRVQQAFRFLQEQRHQQETEHICLSTNSSRFIYNHLHSEAKKCQQSTMVDLDSKRREWKLITRSPLLAMRSLPGVGSSSTPHGFTRRRCLVGSARKSCTKEPQCHGAADGRAWIQSSTQFGPPRKR